MEVDPTGFIFKGFTGFLMYEHPRVYEKIREADGSPLIAEFIAEAGDESLAEHVALSAEVEALKPAMA